jgi:methylisocitrate lyase
MMAGKKVKKTPTISAGAEFRTAVDSERPLQIVGAINAFCAMLAKRAGFRAIYLSGAGIANASHGKPDLGLTTLSNVLEDARRITKATSLPLIVDADTGFGQPAECAAALQDIDVAGMQIEDQVDSKRCGHRPNKVLVSTEDMTARVKDASAARRDPDFVILARTDAASVEGLSSAIDRAGAYLDAGADMIFAEALECLEEYKNFTLHVDAPVLANLTEFGKTPLFTLEQLRDAGIRLVLYPLSAFRAMNAAASDVYRTIRETGTQRDVISRMQTRDELYDVLDYLAFEKQLDHEQHKSRKGDHE